MIQPVQLFTSDPGKITDFLGVSAGGVFNRVVLPRMQSFALAEETPEPVEQMEQWMPTNKLFEPQADPYSIAPAPAPAPQQQTPETMKLAPNLTDFVKGFEGFNGNAYSDFKQTSIGYGTRAKAGETSISREDAEARLAEELMQSRESVVKHAEEAGYKFSDNQIDALTSFQYNTGRLTTLTAKGTRDVDTISAKILEYNKAGGKVLPGLQKRRQSEQQLFTTGYGQ